MGFDRHQRAKSDDDVLCPHCQHRNPANYRYCAECGSSAPLLLIDCSAATPEQSTDSAVAQVRPLGVKDLRLQIMAEHELGAHFELTIKRLFRPAMPAKGHRTVKMFRVVDRNVGSSVSSWTTQETYYTEHRYSSGRYSHTSRSVSYTHYRTSGLSGKLWVEDSAGEMSEIHVPQSILKGTDVGDYILCGWSELASSKKIHHSAMICAMNINKDLRYIGDEMTDLNFIDETADLTFMLIIPVAAAVGWFTGSWQVALITWGVMATALFLLQRFKNMANNNSLKAQERPIWELRNAVRQQSSTLLEKLMALG
ncbi:MAG: zinc ribbon domain-containing protein [Rheinheimera sp.]|nr:zinc ribbon domain-containing protein [Rheinheimera sp.]